MATRTGLRFERLSSIRPRPIGRVDEITDQLYATAPQDAAGQTKPVYGRNVRGNWATADLIAPSGLRFFLGLLDRALTPEQTGALRRRHNATMQRETPTRFRLPRQAGYL